MEIRVILAENHKDMRDSLRELIDSTDQMRVEALADDGLHAAELAEQLCPHVVVISVGLPHHTGVEATRRILKQNPKVKVIAISMARDAGFAEQVLGAGASGFVLKDDAFEQIVDAIRAVMVDRPFVSPRVERGP